MARSSKKARRLVAGDETFLWTVRHEHRVEHGRPEGCRTVLDLRRAGARGRLLTVFRQGAGRPAPGGWLPSGTVGSAEEGWLNLHEPGTVRALLDEALRRGWDPDDPVPLRTDGWRVFGAVAAARGGAERPG